MSMGQSEGNFLTGLAVITSSAFLAIGIFLGMHIERANNYGRHVDAVTQELDELRTNPPPDVDERMAELGRRIDWIREAHQ